MDFLHTIDMPGKWYRAFFEVATEQCGFITSERLFGMFVQLIGGIGPGWVVGLHSLD
jgi:hypothetical protein